MSHKISFIIIILCFSKYTFGQTNTFPSSGNVGIGTISPSSNLTITGNTTPTILIRSSNEDHDSWGLFIGQDSNAKSFITSGGRDLTIDWGWDAILTLGNAADSVDGGKIVVPGAKFGIGTTNPTQLFDVNGGAIHIATGNGSLPTDGGRIYLGTSQNNQTYNQAFISAYTYFAGNDGSGSGSSGGLILATKPTTGSTAAIERMRINKDGNVLIGKTSQTNSSYKLDVNGNIRANKLVVNTSGADYVFDSTYHLPSLDSLANYIAANKHLPDIPPATQMQKCGVDVGENQTELLKKIEELTLYAITENKKIELLEEQIATLKQRKN